MRHLSVRVALLFRFEEEVARQGVEGVLLDFLLGEDHVLDLLQEPDVDARELVDLREGNAQLDRVVHVEEAAPAGVRETVQEHGGIARLLAIGAQSVALDLQTLTGFLQCFLEAASDAHRFTDALHLHTQATVAALELVEVPARHFHDHVIERGLEEGAGAGDRVLQLVKAIPDGELAGDLGDGIARRLRCERTAAAHARIDLDGVDVFVLIGAHRELHVATAREVADGAHHLDGLGAHALVCAVAECHRRCHGDAVAGVDAHRIEVLDGADDGDVVVLVAQQFQFVLLPAEQRLVDHHLVDGADLQTVLQQLVELGGSFTKEAPAPPSV